MVVHHPVRLVRHLSCISATSYQLTSFLVELDQTEVDLGADLRWDLHLRDLWADLRHHPLSANVSPLSSPLLSSCSPLSFIPILRYYANPQTGQIMFFYPQSGNQFVVEGFVIGFLNLACALSVMLVLVATQFKDEQTKLVCMVGGIFAFLFCFRMTRSLYILKNPWYGQRF
jgi:hypothetical protein